MLFRDGVYVLAGAVRIDDLETSANRHLCHLVATGRMCLLPRSGCAFASLLFGASRRVPAPASERDAFRTPVYCVLQCVSTAFGRAILAVVRFLFFSHNGSSVSRVLNRVPHFSQRRSLTLAYSFRRVSFTSDSSEPQAGHFTASASPLGMEWAPAHSRCLYLPCRRYSSKTHCIAKPRIQTINSRTTCGLGMHSFYLNNVNRLL